MLEEKEFFVETVSKDGLGNIVRIADDNSVSNSTVKRITKEEYEKGAAARTTTERSYCVRVFGRHSFIITITKEFEFDSL